MVRKNKLTRGVKIMDNGYKEEIAKLLKKTDDIDFQIRRYNYENQKLTAINDKEIEKLKEELTKVEFDLQDTLEKSGEDSIKPKCGWVHFRKLKDKIVVKDDKEAIAEFKIKLPSFVEELIKVTESIRKSNLNKLLESGKVRIEILDSVTSEPQDPKFEYKYTGGNE